MTGRTILVVDADRETEEKIISTLDERGYLVFTASGLESSTKMGASVCPSLIYLKPTARSIEGFAACRAIHNSETLRNVPVILLASVKGPLDSRYAAVYGIVDYLKMPVSSGDLIEKTEKILGIKSRDLRKPGGGDTGFIEEESMREEEALLTRAEHARDSTKNEKKQGNSLYVGIDLGTARSSVSAGNNTREWIESYVGWPKDFIARQVVGKSVLFGSEALRNRLSLDLCRPFEHGIIKAGVEKSGEAVKEIIKYLIGLAKPGPDQEIYAVVGVRADTLKVSKLAIRAAVSENVHALMVVSETLAVAYNMNLLNNALVIDIGAGTTDFCIMHGTIPAEEDQKTIPTAGDYIDEQLFRYLSEKYPNAKFNRNMVRRFKERYSFVGDVAEDIRVEIPVDGKPVTLDIKNEIRRACESILPALAETTAEMIARVDPEFQVRIKNNIVLAGGGSLIRGLAGCLQDALREYGDCKVTIVSDPLFAGSDGALKLAQDMPEKFWKQL